MAIPLWQASTFAEKTDTSGTNYSINKPSGTVQGDLLVAILHWGNSGTMLDAMSGWNLIDRKVDNGVGTIAFWKYAGASEPASYSLTIPSTAKVLGTLSRVNGTARANPVGGYGFDAWSAYTSNTLIPAPSASISESVEPMLLLAGFWLGYAYEISAPSGWTRRFDKAVNFGVTDGGGCNLSTREVNNYYPTAPSATAVASTISTNSRSAFQVVILQSAPTVPTLVAPEDNAQVSNPVTADWTHNDPDGDAQNRYALVRKKVVT